jgi:hypothetical protein
MERAASERDVAMMGLRSWGIGGKRHVEHANCGAVEMSSTTLDITYRRLDLWGSALETISPSSDTTDPSTFLGYASIRLSTLLKQTASTPSTFLIHVPK